MHEAATGGGGRHGQELSDGEDVSAVYMVLELDVHATVPNGAAAGRRHGWGWPAAAEGIRNMSAGLSADS